MQIMVLKQSMENATKFGSNVLSKHSYLCKSHKATLIIVT